VSKSSRPDIERLTDLVRGRLTPDESLEALEWIEKDKSLSDDLEVVLALEKMTKAEWEALIRSHSKR
jgi:hypothetical protein